MLKFSNLCPVSRLMVNLNYLNEIGGGDREFVKDMLVLFNQTTAKEVVGFDQLLKDGNFIAIGSLAHKIKAPVQMICQSDLPEHVRTQEKLGKESIQLERIPDLIVTIKNEMELLSIEIEKTLLSLNK